MTHPSPVCGFDVGITHSTFAAAVQFSFLPPHEMNIQRGVESSPRLYELITMNEARSAHTKKLQASIRFRNGVDLGALLLRGHFARPVYGIKLLPIWLRCLSLQTGSKSDLSLALRRDVTLGRQRHLLHGRGEVNFPSCQWRSILMLATKILRHP